MLWFGDDLALKVHLILGVVVGGAFMIRLKIRSAIKVKITNRKARLLGQAPIIVHQIIYGLVFAIVISGVGIVIEADLLSVIQNRGRLQDDFLTLLTLSIHKVLTKTLFVIVSIHVLAALFHQIVLRDGIFNKMWFGADKPAQK
jgi:cytochrome b561